LDFRLSARWSSKSVIRAVWTNPKPNQTFCAILSEGAIMKSYPDRPKIADLLKAQRRMARVRFEKLKIFVGKLLDFFGKLPVVKPEFG
jgi:hypothetical protein